MYRLTNEINITKFSTGSYIYTNRYVYDLVGNRLQQIRAGDGPDHQQLRRIMLMMTVDNKGIYFKRNDHLSSMTR